jgi:RNA recognition motif-containing protein
MQIRIGNLNVMTTARQLAELFLPFGKVISSKIMSAGTKGRSRGMGFIEMDHSCGKRAIRQLHLLMFMNSYIEVDEVLG